MSGNHRERDRGGDRESRSSRTQQAAAARTNEYFVPRDGIDREVITADICRYLGNDALVRPGTYEVCSNYDYYSRLMADFLATEPPDPSCSARLFHQRVPKPHNRNIAPRILIKHLSLISTTGNDCRSQGRFCKVGAGAKGYCFKRTTT